MKNSDLTLEQIINQPFGDGENEYPIITDTHIIQRFDDHENEWDIYTKDQSDDSDPTPIFNSTDPQEILNFLQNS